MGLGCGAETVSKAATLELSMRGSLFVVVLGALVIAGCGSEVAQQHADQARQSAQQAVQSATDEALGRVSASLAESQRFVDEVRKNKQLGPEARAAVDRMLGDANVFVQLQALPILREAWTQVPSAREWIQQQIDAQIAQATGEAKQVWQEAWQQLRGG